jgi:hypothetical protein
VLDSEDFYKAANLRDNPFRPNPTLDNDPRMDIWVGYPKEQSLLERFMDRTRSDRVGSSYFILLYGPYGTGKSHALLWAKHQVLERHKDEYQGVAYYVQTLKKDQGKITFAGAYEHDIVGKSRYIRDLLAFSQWLKETATAYKAANKLGADVTYEQVVEKLYPSVELVALAKKMVGIQDENAMKDAVCKAKLTDFQAMNIFCNVINLFTFEVDIGGDKRRFRKSAFLLLDELDLLATASAKDQRETNDLLRHLHDNCTTAFCMMAALTATAAEIGALFAPYVLERVKRQIEMEYLPPEEAKDFIRQILRRNRVKPDGEDGYFPFEETAVDAIFGRMLEISPRHAISTFHEILEESRVQGADLSQGPITLEFLDEHEIIEDALGQ